MKKLTLAVLALTLSAPVLQARGRHGRPAPDLSASSSSELLGLIEAGADENMSRYAMHEYAKRGGEAPAFFIGFLADASHPMALRSEAAWILGNLGAASAAPALISALDEPELRFSAARSLGELKAEAAVPRLSEILLTDSDRPNKAEAAEALGKIGDRRGLPALVATLADEDLWNRRDAARAIGLIGDPEVSKAALGGLLKRDESADVRMEAVFGLAKVGDAASIDAIHQAYRLDPNYRVRDAAAMELTMLRAPGGPFNAFQNVEQRIKDGTWSREGAPDPR